MRPNTSPSHERPAGAVPPSGHADTRAPFYPNHLFVEGVVALLVFALLVILACFWQVPPEEMADPSDSAYVPRPEWYFLFYFQLLKYFEGPLILVGTFVLPLLIFAALFLLPFIDRSEETRPSKRPWAMGLGLAGLLAVAGLTVVSVVQDAEHRMDLPPITEEHLAAGEDIFARFCVLCHSMNGKGGFMAPDLSQIGARVNRVYIERVILTPQIVSQTTIMSQIPLSDDERHDVSAYLARKKK